MNARRPLLPIQKDGTAARAAWLAARELMALADLLREQAFDISMAAQQPTVHWGHAGSAQSLAHEARKLVARGYLAQANNDEAVADRMVGEAIADKIARL